MDPERIDLASIGRRVKLARTDRGLSTSSLGEVVRLHNSEISRIERGNRKELDILLLDRIAAALGRPVSWFLDRGDALSPGSTNINATAG